MKRRWAPRSTLTFFHDFSSPFSYLASTQIDRIATMAGARGRYARMRVSQ